jgi:hypothetical protein
MSSLLYYEGRNFICSLHAQWLHARNQSEIVQAISHMRPTSAMRGSTKIEGGRWGVD